MTETKNVFAVPQDLNGDGVGNFGYTCFTENFITAEKQRIFRIIMYVLRLLSLSWKVIDGMVQLYLLRRQN